MFGSNRAGAVIIAWALMVLLSIVGILFHTVFAGVVIGSLLTAGALVLVVKWSIEDMFGDVTQDLEQVNDTLGGQSGIQMPGEDE